MTVGTMLLNDLRALGDRLAREWMPTQGELEAAEADPGAFARIADAVHGRRTEVIRTLASLGGLEAAYLVGRMAVMRGYSQLGQYLAIEMFGEQDVRPIDLGAALRFIEIR